MSGDQIHKAIELAGLDDDTILFIPPHHVAQKHAGMWWTPGDPQPFEPAVDVFKEPLTVLFRPGDEPSPAWQAWHARADEIAAKQAEVEARQLAIEAKFTKIDLLDQEADDDA